MQNKTNLSINVFDFHGNLLAKILLSLLCRCCNQDNANVVVEWGKKGTSRDEEGNKTKRQATLNMQHELCLLCLHAKRCRG